jgi:aminopeptidase N
MHRSVVGKLVGLVIAVVACSPAQPDPSLPASVAETRHPAASVVDRVRVGAGTIGDPLYPGLGNLGYDVQSYDIRVRVELDSRDAAIAETIVAHATQDLDRFSLDYTGIPVAVVTVDGVAATFEQVDGNLWVTPAARIARGDAFEVGITITGTPRGLRSSAGWQATDGQLVAFGIYDGLPSWLPSNGDPADKARIDLRLDVPNATRGVGPGTLVESSIVGDRRVEHWRTGEANSVTLIVREYEAVTIESRLTFPITSYVPPTLGAGQRARLDVVPEVLELFEDRFGPYPYESLTLAWVQYSTGVPDEGLVLWGQDFAGPSQLAHVLAHLWFSTNVSPARPVDSWLRSSFANYADLLWYELNEGPERRDAVIRLWHRRVSPRSEPPISPTFLIGNESMFSRGPLGLHALRVRVGDEPFFAILRAWVSEHHRGSAETQDFLETAQRISETDLSAWWQAWLVDETVPSIEELGLEP